MLRSRLLGTSCPWRTVSAVADTIRAARRGSALLTAAFIAWAVTAAPAAAAPADPCALMIPGKLKDACDATQKLVAGPPGSSNGNSLVDAVSDPLGTIARSCGQGASWLLGQLSTVVDGSTTKVNFTNMGFLRTYAIVFAASSILVILMWLYAVLRRVINGVDPIKAIGEALGLLWLAVIASAFTPVILAGVVTITDSITDAIARAAPGAQIPGPNGTTTSPGPGAFFTTMNATFTGKPDDLGGDAFFALIAVFTMIIAVFLWAELLVRVAMLYVGGVLATAVYAGLVDRHMWRHVERWVSIMAGLDVAKPVLVIVLITGESIADTGAPQPGVDSIITGLAVMGLAAFGTFSVYRMVPVVGDTLSLDRQARSGMGRGQLALHMQSTAAVMRAAIKVDGTRSANANPVSGPAAAARLRPELPSVPQAQARGANHPNSAANHSGPTPLSGPRRPESPTSQTPRSGGA